MKRENFDIASGLIDRIDKLEKMIFDLQDLSKCKYFTIIGDTKNAVSDSGIGNITINLMSNEMTTEIFVDNILEYYIGILNIELQELRNDFESL